MRGASLRLLSSIAAKTGMRMRRWDFVAAYLQGELLEGEVVYCLPPSGGYSTTGKDGHPMVCKIIKPVYGNTAWRKPGAAGNAPSTRG